MDKQSAYVQAVITLHSVRDKTKEVVSSFQEKSNANIQPTVWNKIKNAVRNTRNLFFSHPEDVSCEHIPQKYGYIFRRKSTWELILISAAVCGIEFCYAAETAFVTPVLLSLGLNIKFVTMIWCLSPFLAFLLTSVLGSLSDSCSSRFGRRRPFIATLSAGIFIGLFLVPYGRQIGYALGDEPFSTNLNERNTSVHEASPMEIRQQFDDLPDISHLQTWSIVFTVLGTILIDFCADVCQSPCRAFLLDISIPEEHATGLSTFSFMSGLGAALGYMIGAIRWDVQIWGNVLEGQVIVVFSVITVMFILCLVVSLYNFPEIPLSILKDPVMFKEYQEKRRLGNQSGMEIGIFEKKQNEYLSTAHKNAPAICKNENVIICGKEENAKESIVGKRDFISAKDGRLEGGISTAEHTALKDYLKSLIHMPKSLRILCLTNLFCWMSVICYCLYFTDFVGESVYNGDPKAPESSEKYELFKEGVRFGCWGMAFASFSCCFYSLYVESLVKRFGAKPMYISGGAVFSIGMLIMALFKHPATVIVLSSTAGIMYTTVFTMPYLLISGYHTRNKFREDGKKNSSGVRGIGTDIAAVTSMLVLSQLMLSLSVGSVVEAVGSNVVTVYAAAFFSACGAISATQVMYLDM